MKTNLTKNSLTVFLFCCLFTFPLLSNCFGEDLTLSKGQTVLLPVYSAYVSKEVLKDQLFSKEKVEERLTQNLVTNVVVHNNDFANSITLLTIDYYDSAGLVLRKILSEPMVIQPMAANSFIIDGSDYASWGAKLLITWQSDTLVNEPIIEGLTTGVRGAYGFSFSAQGRPIPTRAK